MCNSCTKISDYVCLTFLTGLPTLPMQIWEILAQKKGTYQSEQNKYLCIVVNGILLTKEKEKKAIFS